MKRTVTRHIFIWILTLTVLFGLLAPSATLSYADQMRFTLSGGTYPVTLTAGSSFSLKGTLTGSNDITRVEVGVVDQASGSYVSGMYFNKTGLKTKTYSLSEADSALRFGSLPAGSYYYRITAYDSIGPQQVLNKAFTVTGGQTGSPGKAGWRLESGEWHYYRANGELLTNGWIRDSHGWCYATQNGDLLKNGWAQDSAGSCWLGADGYITYGPKWIQVDGEWYYLRPSGYKMVNDWKEDGTGWCYLGEDGRMLCNGWAQDSQGWCRMGENGYMMPGPQWIQADGDWYYLDEESYRLSDDWAEDSVGWMWMDSSGRISKARWLYTEGEWYYLKADGYMASEMWLKDSTGWCYMGSSGKLTKNKWVQDKGCWYYLNADGYMAANEWVLDSIGWCWLGSDGKMVKSKLLEMNGKKYYINASGYWSAIYDFPETYRPALIQLQNAHPNWIFYQEKTGISWSTLLAKEKTIGLNLVEPTSPASYINQEYKNYNYDGRWKQASDAAISYYLDPRNFLSDSGVYQFLDQRSSVNAGTQSQVKTLVSSYSCFMNTAAYRDAIMQAGKNSGVNPAVLTAMVIGEQGWKGTSDLISGTNATYPGIYNHFNVGAYTANGMSAILRGLWWASGAGTGATSFGRPWNSIEKSLTGGAMHYKSGYIDNAQYTYYTKKFNVMNGASNAGDHQYMTNVEGAYEESRLVRMAYNGDTSVLIFRVPVYSGMPASSCPAP